MRHNIGLIFAVVLLSSNCTGRQIVTSPGVPAQIENIIETDIETMPESPQKKRIKTTMQVAAFEVRALRQQVAELEDEIKNLRQLLADAKAETIENTGDAGKWQGVVWFLVTGLITWVVWRVSRFFRPGLPV